ncbi:MAG: glycosyltransferase family 2 protein [Clostridia bacterium]|nr:glycosyltransferase family 2 protein [Clostridia bacterium]
MSFSLIIPHHNIPDLLHRCLQSLPIRLDLQIIVIDDGSSEDYLFAIKQIEKKFPYVEFIYSSPGKGGGFARNLGLAAAKGDYIFFADADDFFMPCLNQFLDDIPKKKADVIYFNAISVDTDSYTVTYRSMHLHRLIQMYKKNFQKSLFELKYSFGEPWCKMVKREMIEIFNISFEETQIHNDTRFSYLVGFFAKEIQVDQRAVYCVTDRVNSVSKNQAPDRLITRTKVFAEANRFFKLNKIHRFDERAIRPFFCLLAKRDFKHAKMCIEILHKTGMTSIEILIRMLLFPFYICHKCFITLNQYKLRF